MLTLFLAVITGAIFACFGYFIIYPSYVLASLMFLVAFIVFNFFMSKYFMKQLTAVFTSCEKDLKAGKTDIAIEKMKQGYKFAKWQFFVVRQIDSQIGIILYANKRFDEAIPFLKKTMKNNYMAMAMLGAFYFKNKKYDEMKKVMADSAKANKKDGFTQALNAYFLAEIGETDKAIAALVKANKKMPTDEKIENALDALKNQKKIKMQNYGALWMQLHLMKSPDGIKQYQTLIGRQKITRR